MGARPNPGVDLLRLFRPWASGVRLTVGGCLLSSALPATRLIAEDCPQEGCSWLICGVTEADLAEHRAAHRQRCHA